MVDMHVSQDTQNMEQFTQTQIWQIVPETDWHGWFILSSSSVIPATCVALFCEKHKSVCILQFLFVNKVLFPIKIILSAMWVLSNQF